MKNRFSTLDLQCQVSELQRLVGMRVNKVYDVDHKTYLLKLQRPPEEKAVLLLESGARIHSTGFEWPKNAAPSGFAMKLRKHLNNKRLESLKQLGVDRVVDLCFGQGEAAYHVLLELYDRGNVVLTDYQYKILNILRPRERGEDKFLVRETYPVEQARQQPETLSEERLHEILGAAKPGDSIKKLCTPYFDYGPALLEHLLLSNGLSPHTKVRDFDVEKHGGSLVGALKKAEDFLNVHTPEGYILQKKEVREGVDGNAREDFVAYTEFHPFLFEQHRDRPHVRFSAFDTAIDEFFSKVESQKIEMKAVQLERQALKKLQNVRKDHEVRLDKLKHEQLLDTRKADLIAMNEELVEAALAVMRSAIANQIDWKEIKELIREASEKGDPVASRIKDLKFETNHFSMLLSDPYSHLDDEDESDSDEETKESHESFHPPREMVLDIDLDLSAQANARKYYHQKKYAANKEQKTLDSHSVAMRSAEKRTKQTLKEVAAITNINKARKVFWFEKFFWFISSENFLVIAGRDMQQNELLVKRYMRPGDLYVHADLHGASSVIVKNPSGKPVPPKTLNEAGHMAVCYSAAWESKVVSSAWWVEASQVSKTAPSGEYLTAGSFMIRGKKNFLPPSHLILGFGFLFKLEESSIERHKGDRRVRTLEADKDSISLTSASDLESLVESVNEVEIAVNEESSDECPDENESDKKQETGDEQPEEEESSQNKAEEDNDEEVSSDEDSKEMENKTSSGEEEAAFPDTTIKIDYDKSGEVKVKTRGLSESSDLREEVIQFVPNPRKKKQQQQGASKKSPQEKESELSEESKDSRPQSKRGKKGKLKKLKKYKDQDDEERELRMKILQGSQRERKEKNVKGKKQKVTQNQPTTKQANTKPKHQQRTQEDAGAAELQEVTVNAEVDMLDSLTGENSQSSHSVERCHKPTCYRCPGT